MTKHYKVTVNGSVYDVTLETEALPLPLLLRPPPPHPLLPPPRPLRPPLPPQAPRSPLPCPAPC